MTKNSHVEIGGNDEETAFSLPTKGKKIWHFVTGDKFEEKAFIKGKVKLTTTNGTKGNQNNWPTVAVIGRIPKRIDSIGLIKPVRIWDRGTRGLCVWIVKARERERNGERRQLWGCCFKQGAWRREHGSLASGHQDPQDSTLHSPFSGYYSFSSLYVFFLSSIIS